MIHIKLTLDKRRSTEGEKYPVVFRITVNGNARDIKTGLYSGIQEWDNLTCKFRKTTPSYETNNKRLILQEAQLHKQVMEYERINGVNVSAQGLRDFLTNKKPNDFSVGTFWQNEIELIKASGRHGGSRIYIDSLRAIGSVKPLNIPFEKIDYSWLKQTEAELASRGVKTNSVSIYLRTLRAIYNKAIKSGVVKFEYYPFRNFQIRKESTTPKTMSFTEVKNYFGLSLSSDSNLYESWLIGKLMFMLIGINFIDLMLLRRENIQNERIAYKRAKTGKQ